MIQGQWCPCLEVIGMDADTIMSIKPELTRFLTQFDDCFGRVTTRRYLDLYIQGQLSDLPRKSIEPMADAVGEPPRNLQEFLSLFRWDDAAVRDRLQQYVARHYGHSQAVGVIDETSFVKKGIKTACVQRQYCGAVGKTENCVVSVHLGYATDRFHTLLDGALYLPQKTWDKDRDRCREAGIPDHLRYRAKWQIALEQIQRAVANGIRLPWLTFDEGYGGKPPFLRALDRMGHNYVAEVPCDFGVWTRRPAVLYRQLSRDRRLGRPARLPRLKVKNNPRIEVRQVLMHSLRARRVPWQSYQVKEGSQGPMVWQVKPLLVYLADEQGLPTRPYHLLIAKNALDPKVVKYFISNAPESTPTGVLLRTAFSRWTIERAFEDSKMELGMDHFEVRQYPSIQRHLILTCVSHVFLSEFCLTHRGEKPRSNGQPGAHRHGQAGGGLGPGWPLFPEIGREDQCAITVNPRAERQGCPITPSLFIASITPSGHQTRRYHKMSLATAIAL
jgi:SRSO17 transposase